MIITRLAGGLGNQIFQAGAALLLAQKSGIKKIIFDDTGLGSYKAKRGNELLKFFNFDELDYNILFRPNIFTKFRIPKTLPLKIPYYPFVSDANFQTVLTKPNKTFMFLDGYFQDCLTQNNFDYEVKVLKKILKNHNLAKRKGCIIHIRGGDFVRLGWNSVTTPKGYYIKAIKHMKEKHRQDNFFVVTDDIEYSKSVLDNIKVDYKFIGNTIYDDFYLIGTFDYRILSASTFAMWASSLGNNDSGIVITPSFWSPNKPRKIFLNNEVRVEYE